MPEEDTYSYKGWLISDSFWKRTVAVWGYILTGLAVAVIILLASIGLGSIIFALFRR